MTCDSFIWKGKSTSHQPNGYHTRLALNSAKVKKIGTPELDKFVEDSIARQMRGDQHKTNKKVSSLQ